MIDVSAVIHKPDGTTEEYFDTIEKDFLSEHFKKFAQDTLWFKSNLRTPRKNPVPVKVEVYTFKINKGKLEKNLAGTYNLIPSKERLTKEEYESELKEVLSDIDSCFHGFVRKRAYDGNGYEESLNIAEDLVSDLSSAIEQYKNKLTLKNKGN